MYIHIIPITIHSVYMSINLTQFGTQRTSHASGDLGMGQRGDETPR